MVRKLLMLLALAVASCGVARAEGVDSPGKAPKRTTRTRAAKSTGRKADAAACKGAGEGCNNATDCCSGACGNVTSGQANSGTCL
jgi:hypothetical protein